ncbi:hypothetical protein N9W17_04260 [Jannaschia sp.]|nr:hypothetical protein [Jannaschia sp.]
MRRTSQCTTRSDAWIAARDTACGEAKAGILIGFRNQAALDETLARAQKAEYNARKTR